ncbi:MAG: hypothetical protein ACI9AU_001612, partial [Bacteroidia bacterium]
HKDFRYRPMDCLLDHIFDLPNKLKKTETEKLWHK